MYLTVRVIGVYQKSNDKLGGQIPQYQKSSFLRGEDCSKFGTKIM